MKLREYMIDEKMVREDDISNAIRDHLSGTDRKTKFPLMFNALKSQFPGLNRSLAQKVWNDLIDDDYLIKVGDSYKWEM